MTALLRVDIDHTVEQIEPLLRANSACRILLTGGTGFYGRWLLEPLLAARDRFNLNLSISIATRSVQRFLLSAPHLAHSGLDFLEGDILDFQFPSTKFSHILHCAASTQRADYVNAPLQQVKTIVDGTSRMLEFAKACGTPRFLFASSGAVYGPQPPQLQAIPEDFQGAPATTDPHTVYGNSKRFAEHLCNLYFDRFGVQTVIARGFAFCGPLLALSTHHAFGSLFANALQHAPLQVLGNGSARRSYLYSADLSVWLLTLLFNGASGQAYNVGSPHDVSILELADKIAGHFGLDVLVRNAESNNTLVNRYIPSTEKAFNLGLRQTISLDQAIERTAAYYDRSAPQ